MLAFIKDINSNRILVLCTDVRVETPENKRMAFQLYSITFQCECCIELVKVEIGFDVTYYTSITKH